jgi:hypothetical protein
LIGGTAAGCCYGAGEAGGCAGGFGAEVLGAGKSEESEGEQLVLHDCGGGGE